MLSARLLCRPTLHLPRTNHLRLLPLPLSYPGASSRFNSNDHAPPNRTPPPTGGWRPPPAKTRHFRPRLRSVTPSSPPSPARNNPNAKVKPSTDSTLYTTSRAYIHASTPSLERTLLWHARNGGINRLHHITHLLEILMSRGIKPTGVYYEALTLAAMDGEKGGVGFLEAVLAQMGEEGVGVGRGGWAAILKVLSVYPSAPFRQHVLSEMLHQWIPLSTESKHDIIASLIREDELEIAQHELLQMENDDVPIQPWLTVLLVHALTKRKDFRAVLRLVHELYDSKRDLPTPMLGYLLEQAVEQKDLEVTEWIWKWHVEAMYIEPSPTTCIAALTLAAEHGKTDLAESIYGVLEALSPVQSVHLRKLEMAYNKAGMWREKGVKRGNMFAAFRGNRAHRAFFNPKVALEMTLKERFVNPRRVEKSKAYKERLKWRQRREKWRRREERLDAMTMGGGEGG